MIFHSVFHPDPARLNEWAACLWQGPVPADLKLRQSVALPGDGHVTVLIWEGGAEAESYMARTFGTFGKMETSVVRDASAGMTAAFARDIPAYQRMLESRGMDPKEVASNVSLRRCGLEAPDQESAIAAARAWQREKSK